jgi:branched-chain amino acid transport system substrate-binding protein
MGKMSGIAAYAVLTMLGATTNAQESVKVGVVEGLSGPPAITDFGDARA